MNLIINGAGGRMGHIVSDMAEKSGENIVALVDVTFENDDVKKYSSVENLNGSADCLIDFSNHKAAPSIMNYCVKKNLPVLIASTGHT